MKITKRELDPYYAEKSYEVRPDGIYLITGNYSDDCILSRDAFIDAWNQYICKDTKKMLKSSIDGKPDAEKIASALLNACESIVSRVKHLDHGDMFEDDMKRAYDFCKDEVLEIIEDCLKEIVD